MEKGTFTVVSVTICVYSKCKQKLYVVYTDVGYHFSERTISNKTHKTEEADLL